MKKGSVPSPRKKCICQICTCGRHQCTHRKKDTIVLGSEKQSARSEDNGKQRKQWTVPNDKQNMSLSSDQLAAKSSLVDSTNIETAVKVGDVGSNVFLEENWSSNQVSKTMLIRRPDNLKAEGNADFTTIHQQDFSNTQSDMRSSLGGGNASSESKMMTRAQNMKQADTLGFTGSMSTETTHDASYNESILKGRNGHEESGLRDGYQRPRTSIKLGGEFYADSSYQREFTSKQSEDGGGGVKVPKGYLQSNLRQEGDMSFATTSLDYNAASTHASRVSDDGNIMKLKRARPESEIKLASGAMSDETTIITDYKRWNVEKPKMHKPSDTLQLGNIDDSEMISVNRNGISF